MDFFNHTLHWIKGELFESIFIIAFGLIISTSAFLFWKFGTAPNAKALVVPLIVVGVLISGTGISIYISNQNRLAGFEHGYTENPQAFVKQEKERVEEFMQLYKLSDFMITVFLIIAVGTIWLSKNQPLHAIGIALVLFALSLFVIDYFSKERALTYQHHIEQQIQPDP